ncbi:MAG: DUF3536 domain-containing protein, partial [Calditrichia bacterium]
VREFQKGESFSEMNKQIREAFTRSDIAEVIRLMDQHFGTHNYSLWHLFKDKQREVFAQILNTAHQSIEGLFRQIYRSEYPLVQAMKEMAIPLPNELVTPITFIMNNDLIQLLEMDEADLTRLHTLVDEFMILQLELDTSRLNVAARDFIRKNMERIQNEPDNLDRVINLARIMDLLEQLPLDLKLWEAQNIFFRVMQKGLAGWKQAADEGSEKAKKCLQVFERLADKFQVRLY